MNETYIIYSIIFWSLSGIVSTFFAIRQFNKYWFLRFNESYYKFSNKGKKVDIFFIVTSAVTGLLVVFPNIFCIWDYYQLSNKFIKETKGEQNQISIPETVPSSVANSL